MKKYIPTILALIGLFGMLAQQSCRTRKGRGAAIGATAGALGGLVLSNNSDLSDLEGSLIGAAVGAGAGYIIADQTAPERVATREETARRHNYSTGESSSSSPEGNQNTNPQTTSGRASTGVQYELEDVRFNRTTVSGNDSIHVTSRFSILTPTSGEQARYAIYFAFVPEGSNRQAAKMRTEMKGPVPSGTWRDTIKMPIRNLSPGRYDVPIFLVDGDKRVRDTIRKRITVR